MTAAVDAAAFDGLTCSAPEARIARMADLVLRYAAPDAPLRVLDLGCGTGGLLLRLLTALPRATGVGIDVSAANIAVAESARRRHPAATRVSVAVADYRSWTAPPFDLIVVDGVLHLIAGDTDALAAKLARDLRPGGRLVTAMPYACAYNTAFAALRRAFRAVRSRWSDGLFVRVGRVLHPEMSEPLLRERVEYLYLPPERVMDARFLSAFEAHGIVAEATHPIANTSLAQLRHRVVVLRRIN